MITLLLMSLSLTGVIEVVWAGVLKLSRHISGLRVNVHRDQTGKKQFVIWNSRTTATRLQVDVYRAIDNEEQFVIVWDPQTVSTRQYVKLVVWLGDAVRARGGVGVERISSREA